MEVQMDENGQWGIVELMGHKVVAGLVSKSEMIGDAMLRVDVPATSAYPAFTQLYGTAAIYAVTFVSEDVARATAEATRVNPVSVYVPQLVTLEKYQKDTQALQDVIQRLKSVKQLPDGDEETF
jgi:hypothetical protein